jgi:hypothetical protein
MALEEVNKVVDSVWRITCEGRNWIGFRDKLKRELSSLRDQPDAYYLLHHLRATTAGSAEFWIANGLADHFGWSRKRFAEARQCLVELGFVQQIKRPWPGHPAVYVWPGWRSSC